MTRPPPSLMGRIALAVSSFFSIIARPDFAASVAQLRDGVPFAAPESVATPAPTPAPVAAPVPAPPAAPVWQAPPETAALQLLGMLQREARFVDFIEQDVASFSDADIGGAARVVHEGCRKVLREHFTLAVVRNEAEGSRITLPAGFDAAAVRVTGNVVGQPPFTGTVVHQGWRVTDSRLPKLAQNHQATVLAPAEVEL